jgi:hypothetical protein
MSDDRSTLSTLTAASRRPVVVRSLVCPGCGGAVALIGGELHCDEPGTLCSFLCRELKGLAVGEVIERRGA